MTTVIDSLVVKLNLDPEGFKKGAGDAKTALKGIEETTSKTAESIKAQGEAASSFFDGIKSILTEMVGLQRDALGILKEAEYQSKKSVSTLGAQGAKMYEVVSGFSKVIGGVAETTNSSQKEIVTALNKTEDVAEKTAKNMGIQGKKAASFFDDVKKSIIGLTAAYLGFSAVKSFAENVQSSESSLARLSTALDANGEDLAAWIGLTDRLGGSSDGLTGFLSQLQDKIQQFHQTGNVALIEDIVKLDNQLRIFGGHTPAGFINIMEDPKASITDKMRLLADVINQIRKLQGNAAAMSAAKSIGIPEGSALAIIEAGDALDAQLAKQKDLNGQTVLAQKNAEKLRQDWKELGQVVQGIGTQAFNKLFDIIDPLLVKLNTWTEANKAWIDNDMAKAIQKVTDNADLLLVLLVGPKMIEAILKLRQLMLVIVGVKAAEIGGLSMGAVALIDGAILGTIGIDEALRAVAEGANKGNTLSDSLSTWGELFQGDFSGFWHGLQSTGPGLGSTIYDWIFGKTSSKGGTAPSPSHAEPSPSHASAPGVLGAYNGDASDLAKLESLHWSRERAVGIIANIAAESSGRTDLGTSDNGTAYGLLQWRGSRQDDFLRMFGHDIHQSSRDEQLQFIDHELRNEEKRAGDALQSTTGAANSASILSKLYVRPRAVEEAARNRAAEAARIMDRINRNAVDPSLQQGAQPSNRSDLLNPSSYTTNHTQSETNVGSVTIHTAATDAQGIAGSLAQALQRYNYANKAALGMA